eukprot:CAMPEP_0114256322 /NCGR_PEP_ID=MMETSP0058-20121206/18084_1 /TAXON_ID=36894 /ORGANISM="Pyramimonas parkeae, CCMP726" /LENGTH=125 /DNA_ID=CAMNT_0001370867 /DNA_START=404 /DNA_END=778 /DNA_ORIENTATION=-
MTRQPTPNKLLQWHLSYIPPKHLRLPGYDYGDVEETDASAFEDPRDPAMLEDDAVSSPDSKTAMCQEEDKRTEVGHRRLSKFERARITGAQEVAARILRAASQGDIEATNLLVQPLPSPCAVDLW